MCGDDQTWLNRKDQNGVRKMVKGVAEIEEIGGEAKMIQCGGHFEGSSVLWWDRKLFIADTFMSVPVSPSNLLLMESRLLTIDVVWFQQRAPRPGYDILLVHVGVS